MTEPLEFVYREHRQGLFSLAVSITGSYQLAEDSIHNAFVKLCRHPPPESGMVAYIFKSVRNAAIDLKRKQNRQAQLTDSLINGFVPKPDSAFPDDGLLTKERSDLLRKAIDGLEPTDKEAVVLKCFAGLTYDQIAEVTETPAKTIATRYRRALLKLEQRLSSKIT